MAWAGKVGKRALGELKKKYRAINGGVSSVMDLVVARDSINLISRIFFVPLLSGHDQPHRHRNPSSSRGMIGAYVS